MRKPVIRTACYVLILLSLAKLTSQKPTKKFDLYKYHPLEEIEEHLQRLVEEYPEQAGLATLGVTYEKRKILVLTLVNPGTNVRLMSCKRNSYIVNLT